jgi:hypothetical protein
MTMHHIIKTYSMHGGKLHTYFILALDTPTAMLQVPLVKRLVGTQTLGHEDE